MKEFIECATDKVPNVRMEFATASLVVRSYFEQDFDLKV